MVRITQKLARAAVLAALLCVAAAPPGVLAPIPPQSHTRRPPQCTPPPIVDNARRVGCSDGPQGERCCAYQSTGNPSCALIACRADCVGVFTPMWIGCRRLDDA